MMQMIVVIWREMKMLFSLYLVVAYPSRFALAARPSRPTSLLLVPSFPLLPSTRLLLPSHPLPGIQS